MAQRARAVYPDQAYQLPDGRTIGIVSEEALIEAVVRATQAAYLMGGIVQLVQERAKTGVPNEMVTVGAMVLWQDRTDAKPQPEPAVEPQEIKADEPEEDYDEMPGGVIFDDDPEPQDLEEYLARQAQAQDAEVLEAVAEGADIRVEAGSLEPQEQPVVVGAPVGARVGAVGQQPQDYEEPRVTENVRPPREAGEGSAALPFQKGDQPGDPPRQRADLPRLEDIAHGDASTPPRGVVAPAPAGSSAGIDDGFVPEAEEDDSAVPERFR